MAEYGFDEYNLHELEKNIKQLKKDKKSINSKLNFVREPASLSPTQANVFDSLETLLIRYSYNLHKLERSEQERLSPLFKLDEDSVSEEIQSALKSSMSLVHKFEELAENVAKLKLELRKETGVRIGSGMPSAQGNMRKDSSVAQAASKLKRKCHAHEDEDESQPSAKSHKHGAPEGYHYVSRVSRL